MLHTKLRVLFLATALVALAGCTTDSAPGALSDGSVTRDALAFPVVSHVHGVAPDAGGNLTLAGADGVTVTGREGVVHVGLGPRVQAPGTVQACRDACDEVDVPAGMLVAEGSLVSFHNLSLNARGPDRDSAVFFHDEGTQSGQWLLWRDGAGRFELSSGVQAGGPVVSRAHVGTASVVLFNGTPTGEEIVTTTVEGLESTVFLRGSAALENGTATVPFPLAYQVLVGDGPLTVQLTLTAPGPALYVAEKARDGFVVEAADGSASNATFDWFVQATRAGGEGFDAIREDAPGPG